MTAEGSDPPVLEAPQGVSIRVYWMFQYEFIGPSHGALGNSGEFYRCQKAVGPLSWVYDHRTTLCADVTGGSCSWPCGCRWPSRASAGFRLAARAPTACALASQAWK